MDNFDWNSTEWAWQQYCEAFGVPNHKPKYMDVHEIHRSDKRIRAKYNIHWLNKAKPRKLIFTIYWSEKSGFRIIKFPDDPRLPGLPDIADENKALIRMQDHIPGIKSGKLGIRIIRYHPESRAVIRHNLGNDRYYARAVRRSALSNLLETRNLVEQTQFNLPEHGGVWRKGCVVWEKKAKGHNLRELISQGEQPDVDNILNCLQSLWELPTPTDSPKYDLANHHSSSRRRIARARDMSDSTYQELEQAVVNLAPFASMWRPSGMAHNDFYDDQIAVGSTGNIIMIDHDSIGLGDPMLDVGRFLAYLKWACAKNSDAGHLSYYNKFRTTALAKFGWSGHELNLREAICLFGLCGFPATRPGKQATTHLLEGIRIVNNLLD